MKVRVSCGFGLCGDINDHSCCIECDRFSQCPMACESSIVLGNREVILEKCYFHTNINKEKK